MSPRHLRRCPHTRLFSGVSRRWSWLGRAPRGVCPRGPGGTTPLLAREHPATSWASTCSPPAFLCLAISSTGSGKFFSPCSERGLGRPSCRSECGRVRVSASRDPGYTSAPRSVHPAERRFFLPALLPPRPSALRLRVLAQRLAAVRCRVGCWRPGPSCALSGCQGRLTTGEEPEIETTLCTPPSVSTSPAPAGGATSPRRVSVVSRGRRARGSEVYPRGSRRHEWV